MSQTKRKILILFAHPRLEKSKINRTLIGMISRNESITLHDLYQVYPDFSLDLNYEKQLLLEHDVVVWHHPFYWYSCPPLLKQWIDVVLEFGWAYGPGGNALQGKFFLNAITTGGAREAYHPEGRNRFTIRQFLAPMEQTVFLCKAHYLPPFVVHGTHRMESHEIEDHALQYQRILQWLLDGEINLADLEKRQYLNDIMLLKT
jgi:glutathione-regulated potassium-efflux system ancillary protein KefG